MDLILNAWMRTEIDLNMPTSNVNAFMKQTEIGLTLIQIRSISVWPIPYNYLSLVWFQYVFWLLIFDTLPNWEFDFIKTTFGAVFWNFALLIWYLMNLICCRTNMIWLLVILVWPFTNSMWPVMILNWKWFRCAIDRTLWDLHSTANC